MMRLSRRELLQLAAACCVTPQAFGASAQRRVLEGLLERTRLTGETPRRLLLAERMAFYAASGLQISVIDGGLTAWSIASGVTEAGGSRRVRANTVFQAGSISKAVTAFAAHSLCERGVLDLDEDVNRRLRSWRVPEGAPVTLRALLGHSAGLGVQSFLGYAPGASLPTALETLNGGGPTNSGAVARVDPPATRWRYSGGGYIVVQQLIEDALKQPFRDSIREIVFQPLGMKASHFDLLTPSSHENVARGHRADGSRLPEGWLMLPEAAAAGLWSTSEDLARFALGVQAALRGDARALLSRATAQAMVSPGLGDWGSGFQLTLDGGAVRFGHGGGTEGYRANLVAFRDTGRGLVVLTNSDIGDQLIGEITRAVADAYGWRLYRQRERTAVETPEQARVAIAGRYRCEDKNATIVTIAGAPLSASAPLWGGWSKPRAMHCAEPNKYFFRETGAEIAAVGFDAGRVSEIELSNLGPPLRAKRI